MHPMVCRLKKAEKEKMKEMAMAAESQDKEARRKARKYARPLSSASC